MDFKILQWIWRIFTVHWIFDNNNTFYTIFTVHWIFDNNNTFIRLVYALIKFKKKITFLFVLS